MKAILPLALTGLLAAAPALAQSVTERESRTSTTIERSVTQDAPTTRTSVITTVQPDVRRRVLTELKQRGYSVGELDTWDNDSVDALRAFQKDMGLPPSGLVTRETVTALGATRYWPRDTYDVIVEEQQAVTPGVTTRERTLEIGR